MRESQVCKDKQGFESILRFLMSWSWRDVSLMLRLKLSGQGEVERGELSVIDYELKEGSKLRSTIEKDAKFLLSYLKHRQLL